MGVTISEAILKNKSLEYLSLANNLLNDMSGKAFGEYLAKHNSSLKTLILTNNLIGENGGIDIANGLGPNKQLTKLFLKHNQLT